MQIPIFAGLMSLIIGLLLTIGAFSSIVWLWEKRTRTLGVLSLLLFTTLFWLFKLVLDLLYEHGSSSWLSLMIVIALGLAAAASVAFKKSYVTHKELLFNRAFRKRVGVAFAVLFWGTIGYNLIRNYLHF